MRWCCKVTLSPLAEMITEDQPKSHTHIRCWGLKLKTFVHLSTGKLRISLQLAYRLGSVKSATRGVDPLRTTMSWVMRMNIMSTCCTGSMNRWPTVAVTLNLRPTSHGNHPIVMLAWNMMITARVATIIINIPILDSRIITNATLKYGPKWTKSIGK